MLTHRCPSCVIWPCTCRLHKVTSFSSRLLDILAARKDPHGLSGDILINGAPQPANFKCTSGYVVQVGQRWEMAAVLQVHSSHLHLPRGGVTYAAVCPGWAGEQHMPRSEGKWHPSGRTFPSFLLGSSCYTLWQLPPPLSMQGPHKTQLDAVIRGNTNCRVNIEYLLFLFWRMMWWWGPWPSEKTSSSQQHSVCQTLWRSRTETNELIRSSRSWVWAKWRTPR